MSDGTETNRYQKLIGNLQRAKDSVETFSGLGRETIAPSDLRVVDDQVVGKGRLSRFIEDVALKWYFSRSQLNAAIEEKIEEAGTPVRASLVNAWKIIERRMEFAQRRERLFLPGERLPSGPGVIMLNTGLRTTLLEREPRHVGWLILDDDVAEIRDAARELEHALETCTSACLETGRAFAFAVGDFGPELILPEQWQRRSKPKGDHRYLLKAELPSLKARQRGGPTTRVQADSMEQAIKALEAVYAQFSPAKKVKKATAVAVFVSLFELSKTSFEKVVWKDAEIPLWRKQGAVPEDGEVSAAELRTVLERLNETGEVTFR